MAFFPFMIQMQDKLCVIGGGGKVAYRKVSMMLSFGARVTVIAPKICDELQKIESKQDTLLLVQRPFEDGDIEGADVVIMATTVKSIPISLPFVRTNGFLSMWWMSKKTAVFIFRQL